MQGRCTDDTVCQRPWLIDGRHETVDIGQTCRGQNCLLSEWARGFSTQGECMHRAAVLHHLLIRVNAGYFSLNRK
jgi:hypothetical protein